MLKVLSRNLCLFWFCTETICLVCVQLTIGAAGEVTWPYIWEGTIHDQTKTILRKARQIQRGLNHLSIFLYIKRNILDPKLKKVHPGFPRSPTTLHWIHLPAPPSSFIPFKPRNNGFRKHSIIVNNLNENRWYSGKLEWKLINKCSDRSMEVILPCLFKTLALITLQWICENFDYTE